MGNPDATPPFLQRSLAFARSLRLWRASLFGALACALSTLWPVAFPPPVIEFRPPAWKADRVIRAAWDERNTAFYREIVVTTRVNPSNMMINYWGSPPPVSERTVFRPRQFSALPSAACPAWLAGFSPEDRTIRGSRLEHQILVGWPWPAATFRRLILEGPTEHMFLTNGRWYESESAATLPAASLGQKFATRLPVRIAPIPLACSLAAWIVAFALVALARQLIRRQRGNCVICGYDVKSLPRGTTCPECGGLPSNA